MIRSKEEGYLMNESPHELVARIHREALQRLGPLPPTEPSTIHYTELPEAQPGSVLSQEWNTYRREVGRLLAEGHEGAHVLIRGEEIIGIWPTEEDARRVALERYLLQHVLIHRIREREPVLRPSLRVLQCLS
jgi:hypothetical protein